MVKEGRGDDRDGGWGRTKSHSEKKGGPSKVAGRLALFYEKKKKNPCKNIIGRKINRLEPEGRQGKWEEPASLRKGSWLALTGPSKPACPVPQTPRFLLRPLEASEPW